MEVKPHKKERNREHIPGAVELGTDELESPPTWNLIPDADLKKLLENKGIRWDRTVVVYSSDLLAAARVIWALMYAGVEDVRLLNGGLKAWKQNGGITAESMHQPTPCDFGREVPAHPEFRKTTRDIHAMRHDSHQLLVSVRSLKEFRGKTSGYSYIRSKGRIPWALWGENAVDWIDRSENQLRSPSWIEDRWRSRGIVPEKSVTFYCGTGWRSSLAFLYASILGFKQVSNYDGSWLEWSSNPENPIQTGE